MCRAVTGQKDPGPVSQQEPKLTDLVIHIHVPGAIQISIASVVFAGSRLVSLRPPRALRRDRILAATMPVLQHEGHIRRLKMCSNANLFDRKSYLGRKPCPFMIGFRAPPQLVP